MNFLTLCGRMYAECGISGTFSAVASASAGSEAARVVNWINQAWLEIQTKRSDWLWMRSSFLMGAGISFATVASDATYPLGTGAGTVGIDPATFGKWTRRSFRCNTTAQSFRDEAPLGEVTFDAWRDSYMMGAQRSVQTRPNVYAIGPNQELCLGPMPNSGYTITGDYYLAPTSMAADADTPTGLPAHYHMMIVYLAMQYYAKYESAPEVQTAGIDGYSKLMRELDAIRAPEIRFAGAIA